MKTEFNKRFNQLEQKRKKLFEELATYSDDVINKKNSSQVWTIAEVISHLMASDKASLLYLQKKTLDASGAEKSGLKGKWKLLTLKIAFVLPLKFKAPIATTPSSGFIPLHELDEKWDLIKTDTQLLLNKLNDEDFKKNLWNHPSVGKMNLLQMIEFTAIHFDRHELQIKKILASAK
jgi:hypothetical protein